MEEKKFEKIEDDQLENVSGGIIVARDTLFREGKDNPNASFSIMDDSVKGQAGYLGNADVTSNTGKTGPSARTEKSPMEPGSRGPAKMPVWT